MLIKESVLGRSIGGNINNLALLENMNYIEHIPYHATMVPVVENVRLKSYIVNMADIIKLSEEKDIEFDDAVMDVADANDIDPEDVIIAIDDEDIDEEDNDDEDEDDDKKKKGDKKEKIAKIVKESVFYCIRKYSAKNTLIEEVKTERFVNNKALFAKTRNYIGDKIAKISAWADNVQKEYDEAPAEKKGILKKIKLILAKIIKCLSNYLEYLVRPDLTDEDFEKVKAKVDIFSKMEIERLQAEQKKLFGARTVRIDINK